MADPLYTRGPMIMRLDVGSPAISGVMLARKGRIGMARLPADLVSTFVFRAGNSGARMPSPLYVPAIMWIKVGGVWKQSTPHTNVAGTWKQTSPFARVGGQWRPTPPPDAPSLRSAGTAVSGTTSPLSVPAPVGHQIGDLLVLFASASASNVGASTTTSDWTPLYSATFGSGIILWYKYATSTSEPAASITFSTPPGNHLLAQMAAFQNVDQTNPFSNTSSEYTPVSLGSTSFGPITPSADVEKQNGIIVVGGRTAPINSANPLTGDGLTWARIGALGITSPVQAGMIWDFAQNNTNTLKTITSKTYTGIPTGYGQGIGKFLHLAPKGIGTLPFASTLLVYLDPDDLDGNNNGNADFIDGATATGVINKGTLGGTFTTVGTVPPKFTRTGGFGGRNGLNFYSGGLLSSLPASSFTFMHDGSEFTAYYVYRNSETDSNRVQVIATTAATAGASGSRGYSIFTDDRVSVPREDMLLTFVSNGTQLNSNLISGVNTVQAPFWHLATTRKQTTPTVQYAQWANNGLLNTGPLTNALSALAPTSTLCIGSTSAGQTPLVGQVGPVMIFSGAHDDRQRAVVNEFLQYKAKVSQFPQAPNSTWYVSTGNSIASLGNATPQVVPLPIDTIPGDFLFMMCSVRSNVATVDTPVGWNRLASTWQVGLGLFYLFWKIADVGETSPSVNFAAAQAHTFIGQMFSMRGVNNSDPFGYVGISSTSSTPDIGPITGAGVLKENEAVVLFGWRPNDWTSADTVSGDGLNWLKLTDAHTSAGGDASLTIQIAVNTTGAPVTVTDKTVVVPGAAATQGLGTMVVLKSALNL